MSSHTPPAPAPASKTRRINDPNQMTLSQKASSFLTIENVLKTKLFICIVFAFVLLGIGLPAFANAVSFLTLHRNLSGLFNWWIFKNWSSQMGQGLFWIMTLLLWTFINAGEIYPKMIEQNHKLLRAILGNIKANPHQSIGVDEDSRSAEVKNALNKNTGLSLSSAKWTSRACIFADTIIAVTATPLTKNAERWELFAWTGDPQYIEIANFFILMLLVMGMSGNFYFFSKYLEDLREYQKVYSGSGSRSAD